jgi:hypothetical protein
MDGTLACNGLLIRWTLRSYSVDQWTLEVRFDGLVITRNFSEALSHAKASEEARRLVPEMFRGSS